MKFESQIKSLLEGRDAAGLKVYLEGLRAKEKGLAFELFLELLYNGNGYTAVRQGGRGDLGADILLYDAAKEGIYCIIQAKNHKSPLNFDATVSELNKFESKASEKYGCNEFELVSINGFVAEAAKLSRFRLNLRDWSYVESLIETYDPEKKSVPLIRLHSHNQVTFDTAMSLLDDGHRVACVQATGTGKSYVIAKTMSQFPKEKKLVIAPSHYILRQQQAVAKWLNRSTEYMTFAAAKNLKVADIKKLNPALIVLDEFHRAGASVWGAGVEKILKHCPDAKVLGTTATPIRYLDSERDMSDELFDAEAVNLSLAEAIQRKILPSPNYVASLYTLKEEADNLLEVLSKSSKNAAEKKEIKSVIEQAKINWEKSFGVPEILKKYLGGKQNNKFIVFCKDKEHLDEMEDEVRKWIRKTGLFEDRETYRVYSGYKKSDDNLKRFIAAKEKSTAHILLAIDMLNEGIHASDVGAVLLFRPTESPRIFYQQIGRCLQVGSDSTPIIFDFVNNFQSIRTGDFLNDLNAAAKNEIEIRNEYGLSTDYLPEIEVHDECQEILETFAQIKERLGSWEIRFEELVRYKEENGDCLVPDSYVNKQLANWVMHQRALKLRGKLDSEKIERLEAIGFVWDALEHVWEERFAELVDYKDECGDCLVPQSYVKNQLAAWVAVQRQFRKKAKLDEERVKRLDEIGFVWDAREQMWEECFAKLVAYKEEHGNCRVPARHANKQLATWVNSQRTNKRTGRLAKERFERLDEIGFVWEPDEQSWEERFMELVAYKQEHVDCRVPAGYANKQLAMWVSNQRALKLKGQLDPEKIKRLEEISFDWELLEHVWEERFAELVEYKKEHGDSLVPKGYANTLLARWAETQRGNKRKGKLDPEKTKRLEEIGFVLDPYEQTWEERFAELVVYKQEHGDCLVPAGYANKQLARWVLKQRTNKRKGKLAKERFERLDEIGFGWDPDEQSWEERFTELVVYEQEHGDCLVPAGYAHKQLAGWIGTQRTDKRKGKLDPEKIERLEAIGFVWDALGQVWEERFAELVAYKQEHGDCLVPQTYVNKQLGRWVAKQRGIKIKGQLAKERFERLNEIGFVWHLRK